MMEHLERGPWPPLIALAGFLFAGPQARAQQDVDLFGRPQAVAQQDVDLFGRPQAVAQQDVDLFGRPQAVAQQDVDRVLSEAIEEWESGLPASKERALQRIDGLGRGATAAWRIVTAALGDPSPSIRARAATIVRFTPRVPKEGLNSLTALLKDPVAEVRDGAAWALAQHGREAEGSIGALAEAVRAGPDRRCPAAAAALASIGRPAVPILIALLKSSDPEIRRAVIASIPAAAEAGLWNPDGAAAKTLGPHFQAMAGDADPAVRAALAPMLFNMRSSTPPVRAAFDTLLRDPDMTVRLAVTDAASPKTSVI